MKLFGKYLNPEEIAVGIIHAVVWFMFLKWWTLLAVPVSGFLWAWGGAEGTSLSWRRLGVPITICGLCALGSWHWLPILSILPFFGVLTIGYGIPTYLPDGTCTDEGSFLGRFAWKLVGNGHKPDKLKERKATAIVRFILATLAALSMISLGFIHLFWYILGALLLMYLYPVIVWEMQD